MQVDTVSSTFVLGLAMIAQHNPAPDGTPNRTELTGHVSKKQWTLKSATPVLQYVSSAPSRGQWSQVSYIHTYIYICIFILKPARQAALPRQAWGSGAQHPLYRRRLPLYGPGFEGIGAAREPGKPKDLRIESNWAASESQGSQIHVASHTCAILAKTTLHSSGV